MYTISRHGKTNEKVLSPQKIYASDVGMRHLFTGFRDKGSVFENYVFLVIKYRNPQFLNYVYENGIELDFLVDKQLLLEVRYDRTLKEKQEKLFKSFPAKQKLVVGGREDIGRLEEYFKRERRLLICNVMICRLLLKCC